MAVRMTQFAVLSGLLRFDEALCKRLEDKVFSPPDAAHGQPWARRTARCAWLGTSLGNGRRLKARDKRVRSGGSLLASAALLGLMTALLLQTAHADVFKYVDQQGNVFFSDEPLTRTGLRLEWKRTATRLEAQNRQRSESAQLEEPEAQARLQQEASLADIYQHRPAEPVSGSMWVRRMRYQPLIEAAAYRHGVLPELLHAVIRTESAYKPNALSHAGACGLMQLMPATAERFRVTQIWDPAQNIEGGAAYLSFLLDLFDNDLRLALAGYNAGEGAVQRYGNQIPPYKETQNYVRKVLQFLLAEEGWRQS